mgnify:CR=1 FL=1
MFKRIAMITAIFIFSTIAWMILGGITVARSEKYFSSLKMSVHDLWGSPLNQKEPKIFFNETTVRKDKNRKEYIDTVRREIPILKSRINADIRYTPRKKGLLWYNLYEIAFAAEYAFVHDGMGTEKVRIEFEFPNPKAVYDNFHFIIDGKETEIKNFSKTITAALDMNPGQRTVLLVKYDSRGSEEWVYDFSKENIGHISDLVLTVRTDFDGYDFPANTLSPSEKKPVAHGNELIWRFDSLLTGYNIGIRVPEKLNPGEWVAKVTFFAPVSLLFFFLMLFVISVLRNINLHPMHYFFLAASFFAFHLLMAYLADHIPLYLTFGISSIVSITLVVSYLRLVVSPRFAFLEAGLSQFLYLIVFTYAHFFKGFTGLIITIMSIITLFVIMQRTAKVDWENK